MTLKKTIRYAGYVVALIVVLGSLAYVFRSELSSAVVQKLANQRLAMNTLDQLQDGLHVGLCGAGSPFPDDKRAGPCTLVVAGKRLFVFDTGSGSVRNIGKMGFNLGQVEAVFLTHFHSDHIDALGELMLQRWVSNSNKTPLPIHGPKGVEEVVAGFKQAYAQDQGYRVAHHGESTVPASGFSGKALPFEMGADGRVTLLKDQDLEVTAFLVNHKPIHPAVGYRIVYKGRSVVLSGDTVKSDTIAKEAKGADLLVHEALSTPLTLLLKQSAEKAGRTNLVKIFGDILDYHTSPEEAAQTAKTAQVGYLMLNHIVPPLPLPGMEKTFLGKAADFYQGPIRVGLDGDFVSLPAGSKAIHLTRLF